MSPKLLYVMVPMLIAGCQEPAGSVAPPPLASPSASVPTEATVSNEIPLDGMLKSLDDLEQGLRGVDKLPITEAAERIARVDESLYQPDAEEEARKRIDAEVDKLRWRIETRVKALSVEAIQAANGKFASEKMAEINDLLLLYPSPGNVAQRRELEKVSADVLKASRRVEDIRRLRYNRWAIDQIQSGLNAYRSHLKMRKVSDWKKLFRTDRDALIKSSVESMGRIDPSFLEPAGRDLYDYVFGLTRDAMGDDDEKRIELTRGFANPELRRLTPVDF